MKTTSVAPSQQWRFAAARLLSHTPFDGFAFRLLSSLKAERAPIPNIDLMRARIRLKRGAKVEAVEMLKEEIRLCPQNDVAEALLRELLDGKNMPRKEPGIELAEVFDVISPFTMLSVERLEALLNGAKRVCCDNIRGNFVECGVAAGGSSALLAWAIKKYSKCPRLVYCFDTFEGMPQPGALDTHAHTPAHDTGWGEGTCAAPLESLMSAAAALGVSDLIRPVKGLFQDTLPATKDEIGPVALLHLDGDWHDSTCAILENLYDQTAAGAYLQVDDYGYWDGCRKAIDEFERRRGLNFIRHKIDGTGIWFDRPAD